MKILFCTNVFEVVENGPVKFANMLLRINDLYPEHELRVLTEDVSGSRPFVHKVNLPKFWKSSLLSQFARMWFYHRAAMRVRKTFPFDVLVYNNALVGLWSIYRFKATVGMINDDNNLTASWGRLGFTRLGLKRCLFRLIEQTAAREAEKIIVNSNYLRETVIRNYRISPAKLHRLYKATELPEIGGTIVMSLIDVTQPVRVLFVKNDYRRGGLFTLTMALSLLPYDFVLTIAGPDSVEREGILEDLARYPNISGRFLGKIPQSRVMRLLKKNHVFCVPSHQEALGVANLEAMAAGLPVVSTTVGGIPEVLDYGHCGWLVPPKDAPALADALAECIGRNDLRAIKATKAYEQALRFSPAIMFENFITILSS